jgi:CHASE3 domain sensor protein
MVNNLHGKAISVGPLPLMRNTLRKIALPTTITIFCALIGLSAYVASRNLKTIQSSAAQRVDASDVQHGIVAVELDLQAIETGQRGYLLTGDASYLAPYTRAVAMLPAHFSTLRSRLATRPPAERSVETELERVAEAKIAEVNETIRLREKGYRHRAFLIVNSNRGKELMDKAHSLLEQMSAVETRNIELHERELAASMGTARGQSALASVTLLVLTVITLFAFHQSRKRLEVAYTEQTEELRATRQQLERVMSILSNSVRSTVTQMRDEAESLLNTHGGFLPRQGQEKAEWIHEGSCHLNRVLDSLLQPSSGNVSEDTQSGPYPVELTEEADQPRRHTA